MNPERVVVRFDTGETMKLVLTEGLYHMVGDERVVLGSEELDPDRARLRYSSCGSFASYSGVFGKREVVEAYLSRLAWSAFISDSGDHVSPRSTLVLPHRDNPRDVLITPPIRDVFHGDARLSSLRVKRHSRAR